MRTLLLTPVEGGTCGAHAASQAGASPSPPRVSPWWRGHLGTCPLHDVSTSRAVHVAEG